MSSTSNIFTALSVRNSQSPGMGTPIPEDARKSPAKIAELIGASHQMEQRPVYFKNANGTFTKAPDRDVLIRPNTVFESLQKELGEFGLHIAYGTTSKQGSLITVVAELPSEFEYTVGRGNDLMKSFIVATLDFKNKGKARATKGTLRTLSGATISPTLDETTIEDLMRRMKDIIRDENQTFNLLAQTEISNQDIMKYFANVMDVNIADIGKIKDGSKIVSTKTENILKGMSESYVNAAGANEAKGTVWGALNAVLFYATHLKTVRDTNGTGEGTARAASNLIGDAARLKVRALDLALQIATRPVKIEEPVKAKRTYKKKVAAIAA